MAKKITSKELILWIKNSIQWRSDIALDRLENHPEDRDYYQGTIDALYELSGSLDRKMSDK